MATQTFYLPPKIESLMMTLAHLYEIKGKRIFQEILVNATVQVVAGFDHDNWNGGIDGHQVIFTIPEILFYASFDKLDDIAKELCSGLNKVNTSIKNEYISDVLIEKIDMKAGDWRQQSGLLIEETLVVSGVVQNRIWEPDQFRVFLSHKTEDKVQATELKKDLSIYGITCFVAHEDIAPTQRWADEIENALFSMDACVAIMTPNFHNSDWTDHELGCAHGRHVPVIAVRMGKDPYGLIGRFQALSSNWANLPSDLMGLLIKYNKAKDAFIQAIKNCPSFDRANILAKLFPHIDKLSPNQVKNIITAVNSNSQAKGSYAFGGQKPVRYGHGIIHYLEIWTGKKFEWNEDDNITEVIAIPE